MLRKQKYSSDFEKMKGWDIMYSKTLKDILLLSTETIDNSINSLWLSSTGIFLRHYYGTEFVAVLYIFDQVPDASYSLLSAIPVSRPLALA
jgi:hypothetical protein